MCLIVSSTFVLKTDIDFPLRNKLSVDWQNNANEDLIRILLSFSAGMTTLVMDSLLARYVKLNEFLSFEELCGEEMLIFVYVILFLAK